MGDTIVLRGRSSSILPFGNASSFSLHPNSKYFCNGLFCLHRTYDVTVTHMYSNVKWDVQISNKWRTPAMGESHAKSTEPYQTTSMYSCLSNAIDHFWIPHDM
ncbi:hypothetical protein Pdw03_7593 [Penicillium digitatum]|uniref:Uncharacterized protein n=1 Tax=Penicillium digitatum TaxID=36651 RepID=A0A7T6XM85_PENDI|nr:hypothetical protein Pdw03_7593 [Penicillium digitatum]